MKIEQMVIVAEIEEDALIGYDILKGSKGGPADILLSNIKIILYGRDIPIFQVGKHNKTRRVMVADDTIVPGLTEMIIYYRCFCGAI